MSKNMILNASKEFCAAYNTFDPKPLSGSTLENFYIEEFSSSTVNELLTIINISERYRKLLVIGHRGCGKSTILNKIQIELDKKYQVVSFSASKSLNLIEIEAVDILLATYVNILDTIRIIEDENFQREEEVKNRNNPKRKIYHSPPKITDKERHPLFYKISKSFRDLLEKLSVPIDLEESTVNLLGLISFKYRVEPETRSELRFRLKGEIRELQNKITEACSTLQSLTKKEPLIIIDDLDKITANRAKNIFFENYHLFSDISAKIIFTYPLDGYYDPAYTRHSDLYDEVFIPIINVTDISGKLQCSSYHSLSELVFKRLNPFYIEEEALITLISMSGGLLRDLVAFMRDSCKFCIINKTAIISLEIANMAINRKVNSFDRVFDSMIFAKSLTLLQEGKNKIPNRDLIYFLHNLFALEYREKQYIWYTIHPCLNKALEIIKET